jgi:hypothetical protein
MAQEHFRTGSKKGRGRTKASLDLIDAMHSAAEAAQPITGRGIGYKLFAAGLIPSMARSEMAKVYRLLKEAREEGIIPWEWIVDETRERESIATWRDPEEFMDQASRYYRRDFWQDQPHRVEVWSEKGTVRGVLGPVLRQYGVDFRVMHGFSSATTVNDVAQDDDRSLIALYVGDFDPSGMYMSERDLPDRLDRYGGDHVDISRVILHRWDLPTLQTFPASDKKSDPRYKWFVKHHGDTCAELDAMDPNELRARVEAEIKDQIEPEIWKRYLVANRAEQESLRSYFEAWRGAHGG